MKICEEFDFFDSSFKVIVIQKPLKDMQQIVVFDFRVRYQKLIDLLYWDVLHRRLSTHHLIVIDLSLVQDQTNGSGQVHNLFG